MSDWGLSFAMIIVAVIGAQLGYLIGTARTHNRLIRDLVDARFEAQKYKLLCRMQGVDDEQ